MKKVKEKKVTSSKKKELTKTEQIISFLDKNRKLLYGFIGGVLLTAIIATIIWPDRIATLEDGTQPVAEINGYTLVADELYEDMKKIYLYLSLINFDRLISTFVSSGGSIPFAKNIISKFGIININIKNPDIIDIIIKIIGYIDILIIFDLRISSLS